MNNDKLRPIAIFAAVVFVLLALIVGGIRFAKSRNASFAHTQTPTPVATSQNQQPQKPEENKDSNTPTVNTPAPSTPSPSTPAPQSSTPVQAPTTGAPQGAGAHQVPSTGPTSVGEFALTSIFMGITAYCLLSLKRSRMAYRRLLS